MPELQAGNIDISGLWDEDGARPIHGQFEVEIHLAPHAEQDLVARTDDIVGGYGDAIERGESRGHAFKETRAEDGQDLADRRGDETLEIGDGLRAQDLGRLGRGSGGRTGRAGANRSGGRRALPRDGEGWV